MIKLRFLQDKWVEKFKRMRKLFPDLLTRPILTVAPEGYAPQRIPSVLYVGKAAGRNEADTEDLNAGQLRQKTKDFLRRWASEGYVGPSFCGFGLRLSEALKPRHACHNVATLQNLVWTNVCKIGVVEGNPRDKVYESQRELAIETLRAEITYYQPRLVFWATNNDYCDAVRATVGDESDASWAKDLADQGVYTRLPLESAPAMIWTPHPARKPKTALDLWIRQACDLMSL